MRVEIKHNRAPLGAVLPPPIDPSKLFSLDVDDDIWQDVELDGDENSGVPPWLGDERVRQGIRAILQLDRCIEEEQRVQHEASALREWFMEEWASLLQAQVSESM